MCLLSLAERAGVLNASLGAGCTFVRRDHALLPHPLLGLDLRRVTSLRSLDLAFRSTGSLDIRDQDVVAFLRNIDSSASLNALWIVS